MDDLKNIIITAFENREQYSPTKVPTEIRDAVLAVIDQLDNGQLRVAEKQNGEWITHQWIKQAVLLYFRINSSTICDGGYSQFYDKVPMKFTNLSEQNWQQNSIRVVPGASIRKGAYVGPNTVLMPCFVNIGAYIDSSVMVDTWATVGSCAQIGKNVHLSGGAGIGGVLEPLQANPTIIEDDCFIGARSEVVEGVIVEKGSVISMGVFLGQSTKIYNRMTGEITYGRIPAGSVVVAGNLPGHNGQYSLYCAVIVKQVDEATRKKVTLNELLRDISYEE